MCVKKFIHPKFCTINWTLAYLLTSRIILTALVLKNLQPPEIWTSRINQRKRLFFVKGPQKYIKSILVELKKIESNPTHYPQNSILLVIPVKAKWQSVQNQLYDINKQRIRHMLMVKTDFLNRWLDSFLFWHFLFILFLDQKSYLAIEM